MHSHAPLFMFLPASCNAGSVLLLWTKPGKCKEGSLGLQSFSRTSECFCQATACGDLKLLDGPLPTNCHCHLASHSLQIRTRKHKREASPSLACQDAWDAAMTATAVADVEYSPVGAWPGQHRTWPRAPCAWPLVISR